MTDEESGLDYQDQIKVSIFESTENDQSETGVTMVTQSITSSITTVISSRSSRRNRTSTMPNETPLSNREIILIAIVPITAVFFLISIVYIATKLRRKRMLKNKMPLTNVKRQETISENETHDLNEFDKISSF